MLFYGFDSSFPTGVFLVEDFKVRRTDYNLVPTIIERFPSRIKVQAFTAEKAPLTTAPAVGCELLVDTRLYRAG